MSVPLAADPYYFNNSKYFDKEDFILRDAETLKTFFGKASNEVYDASKSYIGREEFLFPFVTAIKFWDNAVKYQLKEASTTLSTLVAFFAIEAIVGNQIPGKEDRFRSFCIKYLSREEKVELISSYTFGTPYMIGSGSSRKKHLCHRAVVLSEEGRLYNRSFCSSENNPICFCREWLLSADDKKINKYMNMFATYFYQMRSSVVHDAGFVRFTTMPYDDPDIGHIVPTTADAFSNAGRGHFISYDTDLPMSRFHEIMKNATWRSFENGSKTKKINKVSLLQRL